MWTELTTVDDQIDCAPPYSFYFDLVGSYWRSGAGNNLPLHRLCTLARKQGAACLVIESALSRVDVRAELDALDAAVYRCGTQIAIGATDDSH